MEAKVLRRIGCATAVVAGAILMWLSPETTLGAVMMGAGIVLELVGIALEHA